MQRVGAAVGDAGERDRGDRVQAGGGQRARGAARARRARRPRARPPRRSRARSTASQSASSSAEASCSWIASMQPITSRIATGSLTPDSPSSVRAIRAAQRRSAQHGEHRGGVNDPVAILLVIGCLRGQSRPRAANLDALFSLPSAALTLEVSLGLHPTGSGSVCFRAAEGYAAAATQDEAVALVDMDGGPTHREPGGRVRLHLADRPRRPGGHGRAGDRPARGQLGPGGAGVRHRAALLDGRLPRRHRRAGVPRLPLQAGHVLPVLPDGREQPRHPAGAAGPRRRRASTCPSRRTPRRWMPIWGISEG